MGGGGDLAREVSASARRIVEVTYVRSHRRCFVVATSMAEPKRALVLGASGGCGIQVCHQLSQRGVRVTAVTRSKEALERLRAALPDGGDGNVDNLPWDEWEDHAFDRYDAVCVCLGHTLSFAGVFGPPHRLCLDTVRSCCDMISAQEREREIRLVVVSSEGIDIPSAPDGKKDPPRGALERSVLSLIEFLLPPHRDNVLTLRHLHDRARRDPRIAFCAVRPSDMKDAEPLLSTSPYTCHPTLQNGIFNAGSSTRANIGHFIAELVTDSSVWTRWRNQCPQILDDCAPASERKTEKAEPRR